LSDASSIASLLTDTTRQLASVAKLQVAATNPPLDPDEAVRESRLDAELLLCHCLEKPRAYLYTWPERTLTDKQLGLFNSLIERRLSGEPVAYLTTQREFWSRTFDVTPDTLIPRPETELLVELSLSKLEGTNGPFLDLGTGSGVIAITVAKERKDIPVFATDISDAALKVASANANKLKAVVTFKLSSWFDALETKQFSVIASNPPYIAHDDPHLAVGGLPFEPLTALQSSDNGIGDITAIIKASPEYLLTGGWLLLEHGHTQGRQTRDLMMQQGFSRVTTETDLSGRDRVTLGQKV